MAGNVVSNVKKYYGGQVPVPGQGDSDGKVKVLVEKTATIEIEGAQTEVELLYDADDLTTPVTPQQLGQWTDENYLIAFKTKDAEGTVRGFILYALETDSTSTDTLVNRATFVNFKEDMNDPGASAYVFEMVEDSSTLTRYLRDENGELIVKFNQSCVEAGAQSNTLDNLIATDSTYMDFEVVHEGDNAYLNLNTDSLEEELDDIWKKITDIIDAIDELPSDEHGYFNSSLIQTPGDGTTTNIVIDDFRISEGRDVHGESIEFVPTRQEGGIDFGNVYLEPGTYILAIQYTLQWVGQPRGTFLPKVCSVADQPFDFSYEHEDVIRVTRIVTRTTRGKLITNIAIDADTPSMGVWVKSMEVVQVATFNHSAVVHDTTLTGSGQIDDPLGVTPAAFGKVKDIPTSISQFRAGDVIPVDGPNGPAKIDKDNLLNETAQNALASNVAPAFDPARDADHKYLVGELVIYGGMRYRFKTPHYGVWNSSDAVAEPSQTDLFNEASNINVVGNICWANMTISNSGWSNPNAWNGRRICINSATPIRLKKNGYLAINTVLFGNNPYSFFYGIRKAGNVYSYKSWTNENVIYAEEDCDVVFLIEFTNTIDAAFVELVGEKCICVSENSVNIQFNPVASFVDSFAEIKLREGTYDYFANSPHYNPNSSRFSTAEYQYVWLNEGDVISIDYATKFWVTYFGVNKRFNITPVSQVEVTDSVYTVSASGWYWVLVNRNTNITTTFILSHSSLKVITVDGYVQVPSAYLSSTEVKPVRLGKDVLKYGFNLTFNNSEPYVTVTGNRYRFSTPPVKGLRVSKGDVLFVNLDPTKTYGVFLQLQGDDGSYTTRSWSNFDYVVPKDGKLLLVVEIKDTVPSSEYESIMLNAFSLSVHGAAQSCNKSCVEEKTIFLGDEKSSYLKEGVAHRGLEAVAPENTLPAFRAAASAGFNWVECDIKFTSDNIPVICHDGTIDRTSNGTGAIGEMTLAQLRQYDFGSWKSAEFAGTPIPTLENLLNTCAQLRLNLIIDFSNSARPTRERMSNIISLIKASGMSGRVMFLEIYAANLISMLYLENDWSDIAGVSYISGGSIPDIISNGGDVNTNAIEEYRALGYPTSFSVDYSDLTSDFLTYCSSHRIPVNVYTVPSTSVLDSLVNASMIHFVTVSANINVQDYYRQKELDKACTEL